jgi:hypothetical protein
LAADEPRMAADKAVMMAKRAEVAAPEYTPAPEASRVAAGRAVAMREAVVARSDSAATNPDSTKPETTKPEAAEAAPVARQATQKSAAGKPKAAVGAPVTKQTTEKSTAAAVAAHPADPKVWLQQINALRTAGKANQADTEMRRFKVAFPDYPIPAAAAAPAPPGPPPH